MTDTPSYSELVAAIRSEGEAILAAARFGLEADVPTCEAWEVDDLLTHVASVYRRAATVVSDRATEAVAWAPPADVADPIEYLTDALDDLIDALTSADADTPVWNWSGNSQTASFWARRMAHESAVHRYDAQRAHGVAQPIDTDLATDGLDEMVDVLLPRIVERDNVILPTATYVLSATERAVAGGLQPHQVDVTRHRGRPDVSGLVVAAIQVLTVRG
jgi:uncharacterized protein (TIGR03083 family)